MFKLQGDLVVTDYFILLCYSRNGKFIKHNKNQLIIDQLIIIVDDLFWLINNIEVYNRLKTNYFYNSYATMYVMFVCSVYANVLNIQDVMLKFNSWLWFCICFVFNPNTTNILNEKIYFFC